MAGPVFDRMSLPLLNFNTLPGSPPSNSSFKPSPSFRPLDRGEGPLPNVSKLDLSPATPPTPSPVVALGPKSAFDKSTKGAGSGSYSSGCNDHVDFPVSGPEGNEEGIDHLMKDFVLSLRFAFASETESALRFGDGVGIAGCRDEVGGAGTWIVGLGFDVSRGVE